MRACSSRSRCRSWSRRANGYDAGIVFFPPLTANLEHALPNKFFDLIQARVAIVTGPSPEMAGIVREFGCGVVAAGFTLDALVAALGELTPEGIAEMKEGAGRAAEVHSAERNRDTLLDARGRGAGSMTPRSFLVIVHPYPPTPSSGANRWGAIVKYLRRAGHDVRVVTSGAFGTLADAEQERGVIRTGDLMASPRLRRLAGIAPLAAPDGKGGGAAGADPGLPAVLTQVVVPDAFLASWAPQALAGRLAIPARAARRLRDHELAERVHPPRGPRAPAPARPRLDRRPARRLDLRALPARVPDTRAALAQPSARAPCAHRARTRSWRPPSRSPPTCARGSRSTWRTCRTPGTPIWRRASASRTRPPAAASSWCTPGS